MVGAETHGGDLALRRVESEVVSAGLGPFRSVRGLPEDLLISRADRRFTQQPSETTQSLVLSAQLSPYRKFSRSSLEAAVSIVRIHQLDRYCLRWRLAHLWR